MRKEGLPPSFPHLCTTATTTIAPTRRPWRKLCILLYPPEEKTCLGRPCAAFSEGRPSNERAREPQEQSRPTPLSAKLWLFFRGVKIVLTLHVQRPRVLRQAPAQRRVAGHAAQTATGIGGGGRVGQRGRGRFPGDLVRLRENGG